jgi:hypothetical protein
MALLNPSFEDAGALPGAAAHWTLTAVTSREAIAAFGAAPAEAFERFERWFSLVSVFAPSSTVLAFFDGAREGFEDFEEAWANSLYLREFQPAVLVPLLTPAPETFDATWRNAGYCHAWGAIASAAASFGPSTAESFEDHWRGNEAFARDLASVATDVARFEPGAKPLEAFETAWTHATTL